MEAQRCAEELLWVVVVFQVDVGSTGGLNVACVLLKNVLMSQKMFKEENRAKQERKQEKSA